MWLISDMPKASPESESPYVRRTLRVAIVEDDKTLRLFMEKLTQKKEHGFEFAGAWESAEAAAVQLLNDKPEVVVVDLELPGVSGIELIKQLSPRMANTAFVVLTIQTMLRKSSPRFVRGPTAIS